MCLLDDLGAKAARGFGCKFRKTLDSGPREDVAAQFSYVVTCPVIGLFNCLMLVEYSRFCDLMSGEK